MYEIDFSIIIKWIPELLAGCRLTIFISICVMIIGTLIGIIVGTLHSSKTIKLIRIITISYVEICRGTPLLVQLFFVYFGLGQLGMKFTPIQAGIIALSLNTGAYVSEIIRASISAISKGQYEAALAIGMSHFQALRFIILPQALKIAVPPLVNTFSAIIKDSSLVSVIAIAELTRIGQQIYTTTYRPFEVFAIIGLIYLVMILVVTSLSRFLEKKVVL